MGGNPSSIVDEQRTDEKTLSWEVEESELTFGYMDDITVGDDEASEEEDMRVLMSEDLIIREQERRLAHDVGMERKHELIKSSGELRKLRNEKYEQFYSSERLSDRDTPGRRHSTDGQLTRISTISDEKGILNQPAMKNIGEIQQTKIIEAVQLLKSQGEFCLQIPSVIVKTDTVTIHYIKKNLGGNVLIDAARDVSSIKQVVEEVVGKSANIELIELNEMPCFQPTAGLSSSLIHTDNLNVVRRVGCITALLIGATTTKNFALTVGHTVHIGEVICIVQGDNTHREIGIVHERIVHNEDGTYIDAALIELYENSVTDLQLNQQFLIGDISYRLASLRVESLQEGRVILRAIDNDDTKGFVWSVSLNILEGPGAPMLGCAQIMRYNENDHHSDPIHSQGQSGLLCTSEPIPESGNIVKPLVLLIGLYPVYNSRGERICESSVGVDLRRVLDYLARSVRVGETLIINSVDI